MFSPSVSMYVTPVHSAKLTAEAGRSERQYGGDACVFLITLLCHRWRRWRSCAARALCPLKPRWAAFTCTQIIQILQFLTSSCSPPLYPSRHCQIFKTTSSEHMPQENKLPLTANLLKKGIGYPHRNGIFKSQNHQSKFALQIVRWLLGEIKMPPRCK